MDTRYADKRIVGWYHSHPDFGIFLSDRDCFIHEHFFSGAGQVAYVVDPVRDLEGVFSWQKGKPTPMSHFWVGSQIHTVQASQRNAAREGDVLYRPRRRYATPRCVGSADAAPSWIDLRCRLPPRCWRGSKMRTGKIRFTWMGDRQSVSSLSKPRLSTIWTYGSSPVHEVRTSTELVRPI